MPDEALPEVAFLLKVAEKTVYTMAQLPACIRTEVSSSSSTTCSTICVRGPIRALGLNLSFLRGRGEVCKGPPFRFIDGIRESLFDNPRFQFVADTLRTCSNRAFTRRSERSVPQLR